jgi:hypothetical protein
MPLIKNVQGSAAKVVLFLILRIIPVVVSAKFCPALQQPYLRLYLEATPLLAVIISAVVLMKLENKVKTVSKITAGKFLLSIYAQATL